MNLLLLYFWVLIMPHWSQCYLTSLNYCYRRTKEAVIWVLTGWSMGRNSTLSSSFASQSYWSTLWHTRIFSLLLLWTQQVSTRTGPGNHCSAQPNKFFTLKYHVKPHCRAIHCTNMWKKISIYQVQTRSCLWQASWDRSARVLTEGWEKLQNISVLKHSGMLLDVILRVISAIVYQYQVLALQLCRPQRPIHSSPAHR